MAKIQYYLGEILGRMGGVVFSKNAGGAYIKVFVKQVNPATTTQTQQRAKFVDIVSLWANLSDIDRSAWRVTSTTVYDKFGILRTLKGRQLFIALNRNLQLVGQTLLTAPPTDLTAPLQFTQPVKIWQSAVIPPLDPYEGCEELKITWDDEGQTDVRIVVFASKPLSNTIINPGNQLVYIKNEDITEDTLHYEPEYYDKMGWWLAATYSNTFSIHYLVYKIKNSNGKITPPISAYVPYSQDKVIYP